MLNVSSSTSTNSGRAPHSSTTFAVAMKENAGRTTMSPTPTPRASNEACSAAVPLLRATAWADPTRSATRSSNSRTRRSLNEVSRG